MASHSAPPSKLLRDLIRQQPTADELLPLKYAQRDMAHYAERIHSIQSNRGSIKCLFVTDLHLPSVDLNALNLTLKIIEHIKPNIVTVGSDAFDLDGHFSSYADKRPLSRRFFDTDIRNYLEAHQLVMDMYKSVAPSALFVWLPANHDKRIRDHYLDIAPEIAAFSYAHYLNQLREQGVLYLTPLLRDGMILPLNRSLAIMHGFGGGAGHTAPKRMLEKTSLVLGRQSSVVFGHWHTFASKSFGTYTAQAVGCLAGLHPHYATVRPNWQQGVCLLRYKAGDNEHQHDIQPIRFTSATRKRALHLIAHVDGSTIEQKMEESHIGNYYA